MKVQALERRNRPNRVKTVLRRKSSPPLDASSPAHDRLLFRISVGVLSIAVAGFVLQSVIRVTNFFPIGDDFGVLLNSAAEFHPSPTDWFLKGWADYFSPFPEFAGGNSGFVRPLVNLTVFLESTLASGSLGYRIYILANHAYVVLFCILGAVFAGHAAKSRTILIAAFCILLTSVSFDRALNEIAFRTTVLMSLCVASFFILLWRASEKESWPLLALASVFALGAVLSHELSIIYLVIGACIIASVTTRSVGGAARALVPVCIALFSWFMLRQLLAPDGRQSYVMSRLNDLSAPGLLRKLARLPTSFATVALPAFELDDLLAAARDALLETMLIAVPIIAANLALILWMAWAGRRRRALAVLCFLGLLIALGLVAPDERHYPVATLLFIVMVSLVAAGAGMARGIVVAVAALATIVGLARTHGGADESSGSRRAQYRFIVDSMRSADPDRVFLINDRHGRYGAGAMLRMAAIEAGRAEVDARVVNSITGEDGVGGWSFALDCHEAGWSFSQMLPPPVRPVFPGSDLEALREPVGPFRYRLTWNDSIVSRALPIGRDRDRGSLLPGSGAFQFSVAEPRGNDLIIVAPLSGTVMLLERCAWR